MSLRKSPARSRALLAAVRNNGRKSKGPITPEGKLRSAMNSFQHGLYTKPDVDTRELMLTVGEDPKLMQRLESELREALQPANAMEALIVADIARLYLARGVVENSVRQTRWKQAEWVGRKLYPREEKDFHSRLVPGNSLWGLALKQQAQLDWQIEAKLNLLMRLKEHWPAEVTTEDSVTLTAERVPDSTQPVQQTSAPENARADSASAAVETPGLASPENIRP